MLAKAIKLGVDWVTFLPLALFALQQVPNRETGFSPHQMVYGENLRGPLDLMYSGWVEDAPSQIGVCEWVGKIAERLNLIRDVAISKVKDASSKR